MKCFLCHRSGMVNNYNLARHVLSEHQGPVWALEWAKRIAKRLAPKGA